MYLSQITSQVKIYLEYTLKNAELEKKSMKWHHQRYKACGLNQHLACLSLILGFDILYQKM